MASNTARFRNQLREAQTYEQWKAAALELDYLENNVEWKEWFPSDIYNYELIYDRLKELRQHHQTGNYERLKRALREGLHHDLGNISDPALYQQSHVGTKHLIEEYVNQACESIELLCDKEVPGLPLPEKLNFFKDTLLSYGRPVLLLSGGATLGLFHLGVVKALWERQLLPQVFAGSSAGAIVAAMAGTHSDAEMPDMLNPDTHNLRAWRWLGCMSGLKGKGFMDQSTLEACLRENIGEHTFEEAYERTGRSINVSVSPSRGQQFARLLSGYTSPYMMVWSAALASAAVPGIFPPVQLVKKDYNGMLVPYMPRLQFVDGSVVSDLPIERLMHLYDVNFSIVSQSNPHVVPFLHLADGTRKGKLWGWPVNFLGREVRFHGQWFCDFMRTRAKPELSRQVFGHMYSILAQRYYGDVTIAPHYKLRHYRRMLSNPSPAFVREMMLAGERATWPQISRIRSHAKIPRTLEHCIAKLKAKARQPAHIRVIAG